MLGLDPHAHFSVLPPYVFGSPRTLFCSVIVSRCALPGLTHMTGQRTFLPGDRVPQSGVYRVQHYRHRTPHEITILQGEHFPSCRTCGQQVRFELERAAEHADRDRDLAGSSEDD
jgi:hypothetical protein